MMGHPIDDHFDVQTTADEISVLRAKLSNANALADKLQTLLDSKTHQVEALHTEIERMRRAGNLAIDDQKRWQGRAEDAERALGMIAGVLIKHADGDFLVGDPTTLQVAQHIVDKLIADPAPDLDTVELKDLLDAVRRFLDDGQAIEIRAESDSVIIQALNEAKFACSTAEARDVLDHAAALDRHLVWRMHGHQIPAGHALVFRDGNKRNFDINNLELVTRAELMRRNSVHRLPKEAALAYQLVGCIRRQINRRTRQQHQEITE